MTNNYCVCCGEIIPEGRQICPACESYESDSVKELAKDICKGEGCSLANWEDCDKRNGDCLIAKRVAEHLYQVGYRKTNHQGKTCEQPEGTLLRLPCKIGDTIYIVFQQRQKRDGKWFWRIQKSRLTYGNMERVIKDFGKYVFTMRVYAEKRLKELQSEG